MEYLVGLILSLAVVASTSLIGLERERAFYPTVLIVIALYYVLFAVMGGSAHTVVMEIVFASVFSVLAVVGYRRNLWLVATGIVGHGVFDSLRHVFSSNPAINDPGVPAFWPGFCLVFDVIFGGWLMVRLLRSRDLAEPRG